MGKALAEKHRFAMWDAINAYAEACGGNTGRHHMMQRMDAVSRVQREVDAVVERAIRDAAQEAPDSGRTRRSETMSTEKNKGRIVVVSHGRRHIFPQGAMVCFEWIDEAGGHRVVGEFLDGSVHNGQVLRLEEAIDRAGGDRFILLPQGDNEIHVTTYGDRDVGDLEEWDDE